MAGIQDFFCFEDDFFGDALQAEWTLIEAGTGTTAAVVDEGDAHAGAVRISLANTNAAAEMGVLCWNDILSLNSANRLVFECRLQLDQTIDATTQAFWGLASEFSTITSDGAEQDALAEKVLFHVDGSNAVVLESDDGTNVGNSVATGFTMTANTYYTFKIDATDLTDVKFYAGGVAGTEMVRLAPKTTFNISTGPPRFQPCLALGKTADANTDTMTIDYVKVTGKRIN